MLRDIVMQLRKTHQLIDLRTEAKVIDQGGDSESGVNAYHEAILKPSFLRKQKPASCVGFYQIGR